MLALRATIIPSIRGQDSRVADQGSKALLIRSIDLGFGTGGFNIDFGFFDIGLAGLLVGLGGQRGVFGGRGAAVSALSLLLESARICGLMT